jgi:hypothetical protein
VFSTTRRATKKNSLPSTDRRNQIQHPACFNRIYLDFPSGKIVHVRHEYFDNIHEQTALKPGDACRRFSQSTDIPLAARTTSCYNSFTKSNKT